MPSCQAGPCCIALRSLTAATLLAVAFILRVSGKHTLSFINRQ